MTPEGHTYGHQKVTHMTPDTKEMKLKSADFTYLYFVFLAGVYLLKVKWRRSGVLIVNFEHISPLALVFLLLTLNK